MSTGNLLAGSLWNLFRVAFLFLLIALVLLFLLAKGGLSDEEGADGKNKAAAIAQSEVSEGEFGKGWTDLKYRVKYHWSGGTLNYELFIHPYDRRIERLRKSGNELVLLSFVDEDRERVIPRKSPVRLEMRDLKPVEAENPEGRKYFKGWLYAAELKKEEGAGEKIAAAEMGWLFSDDLLALLRNLRKERLIREAQQRAKPGAPPAATSVSTR